VKKNQLIVLTSTSLVAGAVLGLVGAFAPSSVRGFLWGLDGTALVLGAALLAVHHIRLGNDQLAAGFIVFVAGQTLVVSGSAEELSASSAAFGAGVALWAAALALVSASSTHPVLVRTTGAIASLSFTATAWQIFGGTALTPLSKPLPFLAYPFLVITLFGWAWVHYRSGSENVT